jgi:hypothetical protein
MSQIGAIVVNDTINVDAWVAKAKEDPKVTVGTVLTTEKGVKYISIEKKS